MTSLLPRPALFLLGALLLLGSAIPSAEAGETKKIADKNVQWTLPDTGGFKFQTLSENAKKNAYVAQARSDEVGTMMDLLVRPDEGLSAGDFAAEIEKFANSILTSKSGGGSFTGTLSGLPASCAYAYGKNKNGTELHMSIYVIASGGKLTALFIRASQGAHRSKFKEIDAAKRGVRLIKGAGAAEKPASGPVTDAKGDRSGGAGGSAGGDTELKPEAWPKNGPKWEDGTIVVKAQNLRWTLPKDTPFKVTGISESESTTNQPLVVLKMKQGDGDKQSECEVVLATMVRDPGFSTLAQVKNDDYQATMSKQFHERLPGNVTLDEALELGDITGSRFGLKGKTEKGTYVSITDVWIALRDRIYRIRSVTKGPRDSDAFFEKPVKALVDGIGFENEVEPTAGPFAAAIPFHVMPRGNSIDQEREIKAPGIKFEKPAGFGKLSGLRDDRVHFAVETRSDDGQAYAYIDVSSFDTAELNQGRQTANDLIAARASNWESSAKGAISLGKKAKGGKPQILKVKWGRAKGAGYRFEAWLMERPFVEYGYVVRHKKRTYFIRLQYGGTDAEDKLKKTVKTVIKKWSWTKK